MQQSACLPGYQAVTIQPKQANAGPQDREAGKPPAHIRVDLGAIRDNYRTLCHLSHPAECAPVLKADAYGVGVEHVAPVLFNAGARTFFVAYFSEAMKLDAVFDPSAKVRIYVLEGTEPGAEHLYSQARIFPVINTLQQLDGWQAYRTQSGLDKTCAVHVDTGMNRLGISPSELMSRAPLADGSAIDLVLSHLGSADTPDSHHNADQLVKLQGIIPELTSVRISFCNSSGMFLDERYRFDMTRPGIALYGGNPAPWTDNPMRPVITLEAQLRQVKSIDAGETVGYGADFVSQSPMTLGTLALGYADGYPRSLAGSGAFATFRDRKAPLVGRISMDFCVVDLSDFDDDMPVTGDYLQLIGPEYTLDQLAECAGTISHEILTGLGKRPLWEYIDP